MFRCILPHYQGYIINDKKRFVKRLSWSEFAYGEYQANDMNTLARRESDCTFSADLRYWIHSISLTGESNLLVHCFYHLYFLCHVHIFVEETVNILKRSLENKKCCGNTMNVTEYSHSFLEFSHTFYYIKHLDY